jgi:hypothetical protein
MLVEEPVLTPSEQMLSQIVPSLIEAESVVARLRSLMSEQSRELAKERGVAFIRPEQLRAEFNTARGE